MDNELLTGKKNKFGVFEAALATLLFLVFNVVFMESFYAFAYKYGVTQVGVLLAQFLVEALFGLAAWVVAIFCKTNIIKAAGLNKKVNILMVVYGALIAFCAIIFFAGLTSSFLEFLGLVGYSSPDTSMNVNDFGSYIGYVIAACVAPAICEELLFRGTIQSGLKKYGKWASIISASLIFMLMHGGPEQTVHQFIVGIIVGLIFYETGNLWLSVIVHFFNNFISITQLFAYNMMQTPSDEIITETTEALTQNEAWMQFAINLFVALIMAAIGYLLVRILMKKLKQENELVNSSKTALAGVGETQTILVDGKEIETDVLLSDNLEKISSEETAESNKTNEAGETKKPMSLTEVLLFAIPIGWMVFQWIYSLLQGFGG